MARHLFSKKMRQSLLSNTYLENVHLLMFILWGKSSTHRIVKYMI